MRYLSFVRRGRVRSFLFFVLATLALRELGAQPVVIDFEDLNAGAPGRPAAVRVSDQYAASGVTFNQPVALDYSQGRGAVAVPGYAHSGTNGIEQCYSEEFCSRPFVMTFTAAQRVVGAWVGYSGRLTTRLTIILRCFDSGGSLVAEDQVVFDPQDLPRPIDSPLEVIADSATIRRAEIFATSAFPQTSTSGIAVDDVTFDRQGPPPPCPATTSPRVTLSSPEPLVTLETRVPTFLLEGDVVTDAPLLEFTLEISGGGRVTTLDLLDFGSAASGGGPIGPLWVGGLAPGLNVVTLRGRNCRGSSQAVRNVRYEPIDPATRFEVEGFEITQAIQNLDNFVPLIARKRTVARVYVRSSGGSPVPGVSGVLSALAPDGSLMPGPAAVRSLNAIEVDASTDLVTRRSDLDGSLNFELPPEWITGGSVRFVLARLEMDGVPSTVPCDGCENVDGFGNPRFVTFEEAPPVRIVLWEAPYRSAGVTYQPSALDYDFFRSWIRRAFPTADLLQTDPVRVLPTRNGVPRDDFDRHTINYQLFTARAICLGFNCVDVVDRRTLYLGFVSDGVNFMRGGAFDVPGTVASGPAGCCAFGWDSDGSYADWYNGHEVAHLYGRKHPGFCGESNDDDDYPYADGHIGPSFDRDFGFDLGDASNGLPMRVYDSDVWADVMTYCSNQWISDYTYEAILRRLRRIEKGAPGPERVDGIIVVGQIDLDAATVRLEPFLRLDELEPSARPLESEYEIQLLGVGDKLLARYPFAPAVDVERAPGEPRVAAIAETVPWDEETVRVAIVRDEGAGGVELASRTVSASVPEVELIEPNGPGLLIPDQPVEVRWEASDDDGDDLLATVLYSSDDGQTWHALRTAFEGISIEVDESELAGSPSARFRVLVTDGLNTASDQSDFPLTALNKEPRVRIRNPEDGTVIEEDDVLVLVGEGSDLEDGDLQGSALRWTSNRQGSLGTGRSISVESLSPGTHAITLRAQDQQGESARETITVEVLPVAPVAVIDLLGAPVLDRRIELSSEKSRGAGALSPDWELIERPAGSSAVLSPSFSPRTGFFADRVGDYLVQLVVADSGGNRSVTRRLVSVGLDSLFRRGDCNGDAAFDITDAIFSLRVLFLGIGEPGCVDACDANDDGEMDITDAIATLGVQFLGNGVIPAPGIDSCGVDPTEDALDCGQYADCP